MNPGKGSTPRPVDGDKYRRNHESIFRRHLDEEPAKGEIVDGRKYLGKGGWHALDQHEPELRDDE